MYLYTKYSNVVLLYIKKFGGNNSVCIFYQFNSSNLIYPRNDEMMEINEYVCDVDLDRNVVYVY